MKTLLCILLIPVLICLILFAVVLYLLAPNAKRDVTAFRGKRYAHRGLHNATIPENSLSAFQRAAERRLGVELDVQMTKDKQLVVFHDGDLKRMCGVDANLRDLTWDELCKLKLKDTNERIPLFSEVLKVLDGVDLICEIKSDNGMKNYELCEKTYDLLMTYSGRFCMESFSPYLTGWFRTNHPEIIRGQLSCFMKDTGHGKIKDFMATNLLANQISRPDFIAYEFRDAKKSSGFKLIRRIFDPFCVCWTPKGEEEISEAATMFDTIIFEEAEHIC
ncbi:MAG: glycerophosphodiester phosphodiesterase [Lachnospiraceae bacterium]|nr:glycerophosphodiester phosphodiesterase [Lachnospiraceae bacterium]